MSADNWAICPRCLDNAKAELEVAQDAVMELYGTVSVEEFDAKRSALLDIDREDFRTFREDYEFYGAEEGEVTADYSGSCGKCGLSLHFQEHRRFYTPGSGEEH